MNRGASFPVLGLTDDELRARAARAGLALRHDELRRIARHLGRDPSIVEVHAFDAQWSEHCSYKSSRHLLRALPVEGPTVMQGPAEDAGIVHLGEWNGERYGVVIAHESHNHPSQVVPFEGAATGVGGIVRDVLCMGAEVIAVADALRFGRIEEASSHQRYVAQSAVDGIGAYGNAIGVPNIAGDVYFDSGFDDNCLVNVVALGLVKASEIVHSAAPPGSVGYDIVLVGKATDASGFGGAAFSSVTLDEADSEANKGAVQVPDPFLKNVIVRATYRVFAYLRENGVTAGFKDLGAGGIMGCTAELCGSGGFGAVIDLDDVNAAIEGMRPEVVAVGETQERLCWILPPDATAEVLRIYNEEFTLPEVAREARACVIGAVAKEKRYVMRYGDEVVMDVPVDLLAGSIRDELPYALPRRHDRPGEENVSALGAQNGLNAIFTRVLSHRDVCSREPLYRQYDSVVRGTTVLPRGSADAGVIAPIPGAPFGVALSVAGNPRYGRIDPCAAAELAVAEAVRDVVAVGARPLGMTDCLNFGNPQEPDQYGQLVAAIEGLARAARELGVPFVSGNVSLYNERKEGSAIPASPIVACVGGLDDLARVVTPSIKRAGSQIVFLGSSQRAFGGSVIAEVSGAESDVLPIVDYARERAILTEVQAAISTGSVLACRVVAGGGLLVALARMLFGAYEAGRQLGAAVRCENPFGEAGGFLMEIAADGPLPGMLLGQTIGEPRLTVGGSSFDVAELHRAWSAPLREAYP